MTQERLAMETGVPRNFILLIEAGQHQPTTGTIARLVQSLKLKASPLVAEGVRAPRRW